MKLLLCRECGDIFNLTKERKSCSCGITSGMYIDNLNAEHSGGIPVCIENKSFIQALRTRPTRGSGPEFKGWIPPRICRTIKQN